MNKCIGCGKPVKWVKWSAFGAPKEIAYGFCSKTCIANKTIKDRGLTPLKEE